MILYALTIFLSAFLLFLVQPIMAKQVLPWFGGGAGVWTSCMVFFQILLLLGYAYSDAVTRQLSARKQVILHVAVLVVSLLWLPIIPNPSWKPLGSEEPILLILGLLAATIGLPYFLLSTTGPLIQAWFARSFPSGTVYRLFALSNFASLLALIAYPPLIEPWVTNRHQSYVWTIAYLLFVVLCAASAWFSIKPGTSRPAYSSQRAVDGPAPVAKEYILWLVLSAMGSVMLLAITNHITQNVASIPFLWILPLVLYLLSFILCFEGRNWYKRIIFLGPLLIVIATMAWTIHAEQGVMDIKLEIPLFSVGLFVCCMFFHGELADRKPTPRYLTAFYLMVSLGGAIGGILVGIVAAKVFNAYYELSIALIVCGLLATYLTWIMPKWISMLAFVATLFVAYQAYEYVDFLSKGTRLMTRNFYGTLRVRDTGPENQANTLRRLLHGTIMHGEQFLSPDKRDTPTSYYGLSSGVGIAIKHNNPHAQRVGVIGLGAGTLAVYGKAGDVYRFYEINPQVIDVANKHFYFLSSSRAKVETVLGDARLTLEREPQQNYDVLAIDAFSSDSIPVHLITREAMAIYLQHIKPDGVIAFHVSNRFLDLAPVVKSLADQFALPSVLVVDDPEDPELSRTSWVLVTKSEALLNNPQVQRLREEINEIPGLRVWTDDYNNLFQILK